jgi:hypothetical protein
MISKSTYFVVICLASAAGAQEHTGPQLTARELFYAAVQAPAKPAPAAKAQPAKAPAKKTVSTEIASAPQSSPAPTAQLPEGAHIVNAVANVSAPPSGTPLGLKYSVLKSFGGQMMEVPADSIFHAGDRIQLSVETNSPGYLYVISQGSSGAWKPMFPSPEVADGDNRVEAFHSYSVPPKSRMLFDEQTGTEKLFIVFSREPEPDLEKMIYSLEGVAPVSAPAPAAAPAVQPKKLVAFADASIDDRTVGILRTAYSRDLVIEKVDDSQPPATATGRKETAVYVVNPSGKPDSRLVADLRLEHK